MLPTENETVVLHLTIPFLSTRPTHRLRFEVFMKNNFKPMCNPSQSIIGRDKEGDGRYTDGDCHGDIQAIATRGPIRPQSVTFKIEAISSPPVTYMTFRILANFRVNGRVRFHGAWSNYIVPPIPVSYSLNYILNITYIMPRY